MLALWGAAGSLDLAYYDSSMPLPLPWLDRKWLTAFNGLYPITSECPSEKCGTRATQVGHLRSMPSQKACLPATVCQTVSHNGCSAHCESHRQCSATTKPCLGGAMGSIQYEHGLTGANWLPDCVVFHPCKPLSLRPGVPSLEEAPLRTHMYRSATSAHSTLLLH